MFHINPVYWTYALIFRVSKNAECSNYPKLGIPNVPQKDDIFNIFQTQLLHLKKAKVEYISVWILAYGENKCTLRENISKLSLQRNYRWENNSLPRNVNLWYILGIKGARTLRELFKLFLNLDGCWKCSSVSRIPRLPVFGNSDQLLKLDRSSF